MNARRYSIDPRAHWRKYAPKGHEDDFDHLAEKYRIRQSFGGLVAEAIEAETQLNKAIRTVRRMNTVAIIRMCMRYMQLQSRKRAVNEVMALTYGKCHQLYRKRN